jgi:hypothetical protein
MPPSTEVFRAKELSRLGLQKGPVMDREANLANALKIFGYSRSNIAGWCRERPLVAQASHSGIDRYPMQQSRSNVPVKP